MLVNGTAVLSNITLPSGTGPTYHPFTVNHGDQITTVYTAGSYAYENTYSFQNEAGVTVLTNGAGGLEPTSIVDPFMAAVLTPNIYLIGSGRYFYIVTAELDPQARGGVE
ncbi:MAG: hypothetical protein K0B87_00585 [Candidatus Syntrophosphaera sp.]|nr:hypothetical protein [Candidatus Syntrophosphaera sp.]